MAEITTAQRKRLRKDQFADPANRAYPIHDAAHARNAMARLEQQKSGLEAAVYKQIRTNILRAYKRFGIESAEPVKSSALAVPRRGLRMLIGADGSIDVRHSSDKQPTGAALEEPTMHERAVALADSGEDGPVWIQVAKVGQFAGHSAGPFRLDAAVFGEIVANFRATQNRRVPVDFEHVSEADSSSGSVPVSGAPAQGWIVDLDNRGEAGLWALVEWGELARQYIREGKYKFISPAIRFGAKDRVSGQSIGARLTSAGLTNQPFLDGMAELAAKDPMDRPLMASCDFMPRLRACLRLGELATPQECAEQIERLRSHCESAADPMGTHEGVDLGSYLRPLCALMNLPATSSVGDLLAACLMMLEASCAEGEHGEPDGDEGICPNCGGRVACCTRCGCMFCPGCAEQGCCPHCETAAGEAEMVTEKEHAAMADTELALKLNDAEARVTALMTEKATMAAREAEWALKLTAAEAEKANAEEQLVHLRSELNKRDEADRHAEVEAAFATYKDAKGLKDADRAHMLVLLKAAPESFRALYPCVPLSQQHLLRDLAGTRDPSAGAAGSAAYDRDAIVKLADEITKAQPGIDRGVALVEAHKRLLGATG